MTPLSNTVIAETRICPAALCSTSKDGNQYLSKVMFRAVDSSSDAEWMQWFKAKPEPNPTCGRLERCTFALSTDDRNQWSNLHANIYRDHCVYAGDEQTGFLRRKERIVRVNGFMLDFDSHSASDMPLEAIGDILLSEKLRNAVPCSRIVNTGHGYQIHFPLSMGVEGVEAERQIGIRRYESFMQSAMAYFRQEWGLVPDEKCKDVTRLHRHYPSYNTKKMKQFNDAANRIEVKEVFSRVVEPAAVNAFIRDITAKHPISPWPDKRMAVLISKPASTDDPSADLQKALLKAVAAPCIAKLWNEGSAEGNRNAARFALLANLYAAGIAESDSVELLQDFNRRCHPPDDAVTVANHVRGFYGAPKKVGCTYIHGTCKMCVYQDKTLDAAKAACPYVQGLIRKPRHPYSISREGTIMRRQYKAGKDGGIEEVQLPVTMEGSLVVTTTIQDGGTQFYRGKITNGDWHETFELPASLWASRTKFAETIKGIAGDKLMFLGRDTEHLAMASEYLCDSKETKVVTDFGWNKTFTAYFGVECIISKVGIHPPTTEYFRCQHKAGQKLRLKRPESEAQVDETLQHIKDDLMQFNNVAVMQSIIGLVFIAPFLSLLREKASTTNAVPSLIVQGSTGAGKTAMLLLAASFFGEVRDSDLVSFASTVRVINDLGHWFKDALYVVDDLKWSSMSKPVQTQIIQVMQAYVDGHGRNRLSNRGSSGDWEPETGKEIRGTVAIPAEDLPSGEASVFGRYMIVHIEHSDSDARRYGRCLQASRHYSSVMATFLLWYLQKGSPHDDLLARFDKHRAAFEQGVPRDKLNIIRVCSQLALNLVGYELFLEFAQHRNVFTTPESERLQQAHRHRLCVLREKRLSEIANEAPAEKFLSMITSLLAAGKARLDDDLQDTHKPVIGFLELDTESGQNILYLDPHIAYGQVQRAYDDLGERIPFNQQSLGQQLGSQGYLAKRDKDRLTLTKNHNGKRGRYYAIDLAKFGWLAEDARWPATDAATEITALPGLPVTEAATALATENLPSGGGNGASSATGGAALPDLWEGVQP